MKLTLFLFLACFSTNIFAQDTVTIKTSAMCNSCKNRIESRLTKVKGIINSELNVDSKLLTIIYDKAAIHIDAIEEEITKMGYDANLKTAKKAAYKRLPVCCRKDYKGSH